MFNGDSVEKGEGARELERRVEETGTLLRETVGRLSRQSHTHLVGAAAYQSLMDLRPRLQEGLEALAGIERQRGLTDQELALRSAFRILLSPR